MKFLRLEISDRAFNEIRSEVGLKRMVGNAYGACDELLQRIINSVDNQKKILRLELKDEKEKK